jgi:hypothetical protein
VGENRLGEAEGGPVLMLRLVPEDELTGDRHPERCMELLVPSRTEGAVTVLVRPQRGRYATDRHTGIRSEDACRTVRPHHVDRDPRLPRLQCQVTSELERYADLHAECREGDGIEVLLPGGPLALLLAERVS